MNPYEALMAAAAGLDDQDRATGLAPWRAYARAYWRWIETR